MKRLWILLLGGVFLCQPVFAQQTGAIEGQVDLADGSAAPGVTVEASSNVLPQARVTVTDESGRFRFRQLPPGEYEITFNLEGVGRQIRNTAVLLQQVTVINVTLGLETLEETIDVLGQAPLIDPTSAELKTAISNQVIDPLPIGQEYRDLVKLIPGVQYSEDAVRGPSAGGSGQDNAYQFDGVNVTLPLFGSLSAEPSAHDIDQISIIKGGAKAVDFNRSGGFTINSVSKSGTNAFRGEVSYQVQTAGMTGDRDVASASQFEEDKDWALLSLGGPVWRDRLFFYTSYYRPTVTRNNRSNVYGEVPDFENKRDEFFGKVSFQPVESFLLHASHRNSDRDVTASGVGGFAAASTSDGGAATLDISIVEGSWVINPTSYLNFKYTDFKNETSSRPDTLFGFPIAIGQNLDVTNLDRQGLFQVPVPIAGADAYNLFIDSLIQRYGYLNGGVRTGGGLVGGASTINNQDFLRESFQVGYDFFLGKAVTHEIHVGYQWSTDEEDLSRFSNGWGLISVPGGRSTFNGQPVFYEARFEQMSLTDASGNLVPIIHSEFESQSIEVNDTIKWNNWSFNAGVVVSNDTFYGQGLRPNSGNLSGFELAPGHKYKMYEIDWKDLIQPRLGVTWAYNSRDTVYASYARYNPAASSLPRAASWDRNLARTIRAYFDADGTFIGVDPVASSSGKFFDDGLDPRYIDEILVGTSRQVGAWTLRAHARYRYAANFWEDTNNNARLVFNPPPEIPRELYIENLDQVRGEIGGSSYVIAELDGAFTKYYEANLEAEWRGRNAYVRGSYVWSHYYGNFDQDNTTAENDDNIFIGSSFIADGAGRQLWDFKYGNLRGDRRHQLKVYGFYRLAWNASVGAFAVYQSGQPWEIWNVEVYRDLTGSTSDTNRYAEPAGSRTTSDHYQLDLNYTQNFPLRSRYNIQLRADLFNVFDKQTGYNIQNRANSAGFGNARSFYTPRRLQLALKFQF